MSDSIDGPSSYPCYIYPILQVQEIEATVDVESVTQEQVEANIARCPDAATAEKMIARIDEIRKVGNSVGGMYVCMYVCATVGGDDNDDDDVCMFQS